MMLLLSFSESH